jgi:predicted ATP-dependent endonuclease of OLD family
MQQILSFHNTPIANDFHFENSNNNEPELAINRINILVGANNAGKSRFMREIMKMPYLFTENATTYCQKIKTLITKIPTRLSENIYIQIEYLSSNEKIKVDDTFFNKVLENLDRLSNNDVVALENYLSNIRVLSDIVKNNEYVNKEDKNVKISEIDNRVMIDFGGGFPASIPFHLIYEQIDKIFEIKLPAFKISFKTYIPTLRSAVTFIDGEKEVFEVVNKEEKNKNLFKTSVKHNYELPDDLDIFTGRDLYDTILASKNSDESVRKEFKKFEKFIGETFFGKTIEITSIYSDKHDKRHIKVAFEGEQERELHNYGDGIQTLMLLTYKLFMAQKGEWIFIEEPELNLHPALQREFLRLITENKDIIAKELRIFFTTHSNHLLDLTITGNDDISIFVFEREKTEVLSKSKIREISHTDLKILHELGVHNSSVFLANCSIWVEGITDRMYVKTYLQAYLAHKNEANRWKEDRHYSFFEYAGSNIVHYDFDNEEDSELINAKFLAKNVMLVADADMGKEAKHEKFEKQLGDKHYIKLEVREIENLLSNKQLKSALLKIDFKGDKDMKSDKFDKVEFIETKYQKITKQYLRNHIVDVLKENEIEIPKSLDTVKNETFSSDHKVKLASAVVKDINDKNIEWAYLSEKARKMTEKIYDFIAEKNKGVIN